MKKWFYFLIAIILYMIVHEYFHCLMSVLFDEYDKIKIHWYGPETIYNTPVEERIPGIKWFLISGLSNFFTLAIGYLTFLLRSKIIYHFQEDILVKNLLYSVTVVFLLFDAVNLSIGPIIYGGDIYGIATGLNIKPWIIQIFFGIVLLINRELVVSLMKSYNVYSRIILFKSWLHK
jgi:hypothetical protein